MAMAADSSANHHSSSGGIGNRRSSLLYPWAKVVRGGGDPESISGGNQSPPSSSSSLSSMGTSATEQFPFSDCSPSSKAAARSSPPPQTADDSSSAAEVPNGHNSNAAGPKKPAWSKPSNGDTEVGPVTVMGAVSWPALSESTRASPKLPAADSSPKTVTPRSPSVVSQGPAMTHQPNSKKHPTNNANPNSTSNHALPARQRPVKCGSGGSTGAGNTHSSFAHSPTPTPPPPPPFPVLPILPDGYGNLVPAAMTDPSPRETPFWGNSWDARLVGGFVPQSHPVNDHRSSSRRGNSGPHPRGNGSYHNNHGGKRDHDHGNHMNARDVHMQPHRAPPRGLVRPAPTNTGVFPPQPVRPFGNPMGYPEFVYIPTLPLEPIRGMPFISQAPHPAMFIPVAESPLPSLIINQIDYYFSDANLIKDDFLRSNMDAQGWVPVSLIANFPRVKGLTTNIQLILDSLRASSIVEVQDDKLRRRNEWRKWIPTSGQLPPQSGSPSPDALSNDILATSFGNMTVEEVAPNQSSIAGNPDSNSVGISESCSARQSQLPNGDVTQNSH